MDVDFVFLCKGVWLKDGFICFVEVSLIDFFGIWE